MEKEQAMIIGRETEQERLLHAYESDYSRLVIVYGRRRVGKTFLVNETFRGRLFFEHTGEYIANDGTKTAREMLLQELQAFRNSLLRHGLDECPLPADWREAFELLKDLIGAEDLTAEQPTKKVIFLDELSWMETPESDFLSMLSSFWNGWASKRHDILMVVCASSTSWIFKRLLADKGGLYRRQSDVLNIKPFNLRECEEFAEYKHLAMSRKNIIEAYMILGGIPYYWDDFLPMDTVASGVNRMFFGESPTLDNEFEMLFRVAFEQPLPYVKVITALSEKGVGMLREEIIKSSGLSDGGTLSTLLEDLEKAGFIRRYAAFGKAKKDSMYQLIDNFTLFYFKFMKEGTRYSDDFTQIPAKVFDNWAGHAFERVCLLHSEQIKKKLGISGIPTNVCSWQCRKDPENGIEGAQIDLVIDKGSLGVNLCEMRFYKDDYPLSEKDEKDFSRKRNSFRLVTKIKKPIQTILVTTYGIVRNKYAGIVNAVVTADDLFAEI